MFLVANILGGYRSCCSPKTTNIRSNYAFFLLQLYLPARFCHFKVELWVMLLIFEILKLDVFYFHVVFLGLSCFCVVTKSFDDHMNCN